MINWEIFALTKFTEMSKISGWTLADGEVSIQTLAPVPTFAVLRELCADRDGKRRLFWDS